MGPKNFLWKRGGGEKKTVVLRNQMASNCLDSKHMQVITQM